MKKRFTILAAAFALLAFLTIPMGMRGQTRESYSETYDVTALGDMFIDGSSYASANGYWKVPAEAGNTAMISIPITEQPESNISVSFRIATFGNGTNPSASNTTVTAVGTETNSNWTGSDVSSYPSSSSYVTGVMTITKPQDPTTLGGLVITMGVNSGVKLFRLQSVTIEYTYGGGSQTETYTVTYDCNGGTSGCPENETGIEASTQIQLAAAPTKTDYTFDGWSDGSTTYQAGANYTVNGNVTMTAQWTEIVSGDEQWVLTNLADLTASDVFVIVGNNGSDYAMSNDGGTTSAPSAVAVTVNGNEITSAVPSTIKWTISGNASDGYTFYPNGSTTTWLYCYNNNNGLRVGTSADKTFVVNSNYLYNVGQNRYIGIYNSQDWRCYTSINNNIQNQTFAFYKKVTGGVIPPSITAANVDIAYNATSGSITYTINNGVTGGTMSVATESDWLTLGQGTTSPISFTCSANSAGTDRTATVTLTYTYNRATVTANVIVTQAGNPDATMIIAEVRAQGTGNVATLGTVTSITGTSNKTAYIQDATAAIVVYGNFTAALGDEIRVSGTLSDFNGLLEITNPVVTVVSTGNTINPELMTIAEVVASTNQGWYIRIDGAKVTNISGSGNSQNTTISQGENTIVVHGNLGITVAVNDIVNLNGNIGYYNGNQIANPQNVEVQPNTEPSINISNATVNVPAEGTEGTIAVDYQNFTELAATIYFCNAAGTEVVNYDWIDAEVNDEDNIAYTVSANNGEARTAYLKVYSGNIYSNLVTINQAAYVAPTYAELPFGFNGGRAAIEETDGLSQDGLGTDYNAESNPNTKLKFDGTGDWLLLQFNERPGTLTFNIKNNSFSGGTFKVQTSEDGVTYTDLAIYTEITGTQDEEFSDLGENVRYIKWIYTNKVSGNVGLGNIVLNEYTEPVPAIILDTYAIDVPAEGGEGTINVTCQNLPVDFNYNMSVWLCDDSGEFADYDWITVEMDANHNVHYVVSANQGDARLAYFRVECYEDPIIEGKSGWWIGSVLSDLVTVSQAAYVAPSTTGTIMFGNNEGRTPINAASVTGNDSMGNSWTITTIGTTSFTQHGDYSQVGSRSNPATSITFTTTLPEAMTITSFEARFSGYSGTAGTINLLVDEQNVGTGSLNESEEITVENTISAMGTVLTVTVTDIERGVNCYYISYTIGTNITVTQTIELAAGWNWISLEVEGDPFDLLYAFQEGLEGTELTIKSRNQYTNYEYDDEYDEYYWDGSLERVGMNASTMYMVYTNVACTVELEGTPVTPANHPITIEKGWNWIPYPSTQAMGLEDALADFVTEEGDALKTRNRYANYLYDDEYDEYYWDGSLTQLTPGEGLMFYSDKDGTRTLVFASPAKARKIAK